MSPGWLTRGYSAWPTCLVPGGQAAALHSWELRRGERRLESEARGLHHLCALWVHRAQGSPPPRDPQLPGCTMGGEEAAALERGLPCEEGQSSSWRGALGSESTDHPAFQGRLQPSDVTGSEGGGTSGAMARAQWEGPGCPQGTSRSLEAGRGWSECAGPETKAELGCVLLKNDGREQGG